MVRRKDGSSQDGSSRKAAHGAGLYATLAALPDLRTGDVHISDFDTSDVAQNGKPGFAGLSKSSGGTSVIFRFSTRAPAGAHAGGEIGRNTKQRPASREGII
jgi:hypothetical protein